MKFTLTFIILFFIYSHSSFTQSRPFPQNINYSNGYKSSAFSEQTMRNAYNQWKGLFLQSCNGMYRVSEDNASTSISEGIGFGMLLTAYYGEKEYFDGLLEFYKSKRTDWAYNLMGWRVTCDSIIDQGSATDGDIDVAFSLIVANTQWGGNYLDEAKNIISILKQNYFVKCDRGYYVMKPGGRFGGCNLTDIQYYTPAYFRIFGTITNDPFWETIARHTYIILENGANDSTGLVPDWQTPDGTPGGQGRTDYYRYDACRTPWRMSLDYLWNGNTTAREWCTRISNFAASIGASRIVDGYNLDGTPRGQYNNSPFVGGFAVGSMCNSQTIVDQFSQRLLQLNNGGSDNTYFNLSLRNIYMLVLSGNFWDPLNPNTALKKNDSSPKNFDLLTNYPNPFNPTTTISYSVAKSSFVKIEIFNVLGEKVRILVNEFKNKGEYSVVWDSKDGKNNSVCSGIYFYNLSTNNYTVTKKMVLLK